MYDNPDRRMYQFGSFDFGGGADGTFAVLGPKGKKGRLVDYGVHSSSEAFAAGTALPKMSVGVSGSTASYGALFSLGALALNSSKSVATTYKPTDTSWATYMTQPTIAADTVTLITCVAGTGSGLTGQAIPYVVIDWDW